MILNEDHQELAGCLITLLLLAGVILSLGLVIRSIDWAFS